MAKDNQPELVSQVEKIFKLQQHCAKDETINIGHGRIETRICEATDKLSFLDDKELWTDLKSVVKVTSHRYIKKTGKSTIETRYYISSLSPDPKELNRAIRAHWAIENNLHWTLDVVFNEDKSRKNRDNSPANFNIIRKVALALLEKEITQKGSKNTKRGKAALDDEYRKKLLDGIIN